jgi:endonuclease/exonuclease/phosphatase (EEP) superfamily protein YafD
MRFLGRLLAGLAGAAAFGLSFVALIGAAGANGGRFSDWLDVLAHFTPIWLALAIAAALLTLPTPKSGARTTTRWMSGLAAGLAILLMAPELWAARPKPAPKALGARLKLIQLNSWSGRNTDIEGTLDWLDAQKADVIVLEEVKKPLREAILRRGGYHVTCEWSSLCGVTILSRVEPIATGTPNLPGHKFPVARATFAAPGGPFTVIGAHYTWPIPPGHQQQQGERLSALIAHFQSDRLIVTGDFNSTPWSFTRRREDRMFDLERRTRALFSWPRVMSRGRIVVPFPFLPIDHVYAGQAWRTVSIARGPKLGSDHYPVIAVLALSSSASKPSR